MAEQDWRPGASRDMLVARAKLFARIRRYFAERDVLEVDTPCLSRGAASEPQLASFSLEQDPRRRLISSPEYALKRLLAAGYGPVYRLGPVFRADEAGRWHNPEFCMLEWYRPGFDYRELMVEVSALLRYLLPDIEDTQYMPLADVLKSAAGVDPHTADVRQLRAAAADRGWLVPGYPADDSPGARIFWLDVLAGFAIPALMAESGPCLVYDYPACMAALTRVRAGPPPVAERFELYWRGVELANGGSELTDAAELEKRFAQDRETRAAAGEAVAVGDARLLAAQQSGLPECAGVALGVDRLLALIHGYKSIEAVLPFDWTRA